MEEEENLNNEEFDEVEDDSMVEEPSEMDESSDDGGSYNDNNVGYSSPQNRFRQNREYKNRQYYKDQVNETGEKRDLAKQKANDLKQKKEEAKNNYNAAKDGDNKEQKKAAKDDYKKAKSENKEANKELKQARRDNRNARFDQANDMANRVLHPIDTGKNYLKDKAMNPVNQLKDKAKDKLNKPIDAAKDKAKTAAKEGAKKVGNAAKEGAKKAGKTIVDGIAKLVAKIPPQAWPIILAVIAIFIVIIILLAVFADDDSKGVLGSAIASTTCEYENMGGINDETQVELISCNSPYNVIETIPLEKYIAGVALAEMGDDYPSDEAMKTQLIAVRSFTLTRNIPVYTVGYVKERNVIRMRWCENDQVYWDYTKDLYREGGHISNYSHDASSGYKKWKDAISKEKQEKYETLARSVAGMYLVDSSGKAINTPYIDKTTDSFINQAVNNAGTSNGNYTAILMQHYPNAAKVAQAECTTASYYDGEAGPYSNWKQKCYGESSQWCGIWLGNNSGTTMEAIGCYVTSIAMQIAHSGVSTGNLSPFNPGTFATALKAEGAFGDRGGLDNASAIPKVVPGFHESYRVEYKPTNAQLKSAVESGCYVVLVVNNGGHFVSLDASKSAASGWQEIYIWDPASEKPEKQVLSTSGYKLSGYRCFTK